MSTTMPVGTIDELRTNVRNVFAEVTRYPLDILQPDASLEEDLGIDSVKLAEVFSVLGEQYSLPEPESMDIPREKFRTMNSISEALHEFLSNGHSPSPPTSPAQPIDPVESNKDDVDGGAHQAFSPMASPTEASGNAAASTRPSAAAASRDLEALRSEILAVFVEVTRYPPEILDPQANLEEELGIDSVKLAEIFSVLGEKYDLPSPENLDIPRESLLTIQGIAEALDAFLSARESGALTEASTESTSHAPAAPMTQAPVALPPPVAPPTVAAAPVVARAVSDGAPPPNGARANPASLDAALSNSFASLTAEEKPFSGKIAFVSGSGRALGKHIAVYLAELGATVAVNSFHSRNLGIETAAEINASGGKAIHIWGSMANPKHVAALFDEIEERFGVLDFFVANASNGMLAPIELLTAEHWEKAFRTNLVGLHQSAVRAAQLMKKQGGGKIITMSSPAAHGYVEYFACMGAVKAAVESLTRSLAIEFSPYNIQVNCVSPGPIYGELLEKWPDSRRLVAEWEEATAYGRLCEGRDVAHFLAYLLSEPVKLFTGSVLVMDGGISARGW